MFSTLLLSRILVELRQVQGFPRLLLKVIHIRIYRSVDLKDAVLGSHMHKIRWISGMPKDSLAVPRLFPIVLGVANMDVREVNLSAEIRIHLLCKFSEQWLLFHTT